MSHVATRPRTGRFFYGKTTMTESRKLPTKHVTKRYNICSRTLDRWLERAEMAFPKPLLINGRRYFDETELVAWERERARGSAAA